MWNFTVSALFAKKNNYSLKKGESTMCVDHRISCTCGAKSASFNFKNDVLPHDVLLSLSCPACSENIQFDSATMLRDNGWIIEYDMEIVHFMRQKLPAADLSPEFIFDEGYCTWRGVYPTDDHDAAKERDALIALAKTDRKRYFEEFKKWGIQRMERLAREGWRKANEREPVRT